MFKFLDKRKFKRYKWLFKNLTFFQIVKYVVMKKTTFVYNSSKLELLEKKYEIDYKVSIEEKGTLLIKPSGMKRADKIIKELRKYNVMIENAIQILDYAIYAENVFITASDRERKIWTEILKTYFSDYCNEGILLYLNKGNDEVSKIKNSIRKKMGISFFKVIDGEKKWISGITPIHSSNMKERVLEESVIRSMLVDGKAVIRNDLISKDSVQDVS